MTENPVPNDAGLILDRIAAAQGEINVSRPETLERYNFLVARLVDQLLASEQNYSEYGVTLKGAQKRYRLTIEEPEDLKDQSHKVIPVDRLEFSGEYAEEARQIHWGLGAPVIVRKPLKANQHPHQIPYRPLTALIDARTSSPVLRFLDPFSTDSVSLSGVKVRLSAGYSAACSFGISDSRIDKLGFARMLNPSRYDQTTTLAFLQPYDPERIPVLMVHGLQSTPATWLPMYLELMEDPQIRQKCQFWIFSYPSGYPFPYSASLLRDELKEVDQLYPDHKDIILMGHSMGTLLSRLMISEGGMDLWNQFFKRPPEDLKLNRKSRRLVTDLVMFKSRPNIERAIFYSGPHQGSEMALGWIGRLGSRLIRLPSTFADVRNSLINILTVDTAAMKLDRAPNSIDTLSPNNRMVKVFAKLPRRPDVPVHSIMGDRGKGDTPDSSDGIVPYWSAHLQNQASEKIVPSGHGSHAHPEGIAEARRILRKHIGLKAKE